jgi:hypothetical protein
LDLTGLLELNNLRGIKATVGRGRMNKSTEVGKAKHVIGIMRLFW